MLTMTFGTWFVVDWTWRQGFGYFFQMQNQVRFDWFVWYCNLKSCSKSHSIHQRGKNDSDVYKMSKNQKIHGIHHKIQTRRGIRKKYAPKEPQNQVEFETFSLTSPSGQLFGCEIEKKFEIHQNRHILHSAKLKKKIIIQIPCKFSELWNQIQEEEIKFFLQNIWLKVWFFWFSSQKLISKIFLVWNSSKPAYFGRGTFFLKNHNSDSM